MAWQPECHLLRHFIVPGLGGLHTAMFHLLPTTLRALIATLIWSKETNSIPSPLRFQLRHEHGVSTDSRTIFADVPPSFTAETYQISTTDVKTYYPDSFTSFTNARTRSMRHMQSEPLTWKDKDVAGPNVEKRETLLQLAKMTYNSYALPASGDWYDLGSEWNTVRH